MVGYKNSHPTILGSSLSLPAYGREGQGQHLFFMATHFAKRNTKFGSGVQFGAPQLRGRQFRSKKVRISSNKRTRIKLSGILPTDFAARSAAESMGKMPESQILVQLYNKARTYFIKNC